MDQRHCIARERFVFMSGVFLYYKSTANWREFVFRRRYMQDRYKSSTFNTCEHQPLPPMSSPPMQLVGDTTATPVTHHNPVPVPLHWQEEGKAGLDQTVRVCVIEPVSIDEPVTWYDRMA